jgi:hypothetical protein
LNAWTKALLLHPTHDRCDPGSEGGKAFRQFVAIALSSSCLIHGKHSFLARREAAPRWRQPPTAEPLLEATTLLYVPLFP